jgi:hypothetical protein
VRPTGKTAALPSESGVMPPTEAALLVLRNFQPLLIFRREGQELIHGRLIMDRFGEATAPSDLLKQIGRFIYLIR